MVQLPPTYELVDYQLTSTAPSHKFGPKNCSTKTENALPSIAPFRAINPTNFFKLIAPITVTFAPHKMVLNRRVFYQNSKVHGSVSTTIKRPFYPKKRGCPGRFFSPDPPNKQHLRICTRSVAD
jgi:hypothetical protein